MKNYFGAPIKKLGFGFMRLPLLEDNNEENIDYEQVNKMTDVYLEKGFTYFDTAFLYHGGNSEIAIRKALTERYDRDKFQVTTKLPLHSEVSKDEMWAMTAKSLERTGLDFFDLYFLHGIGPGRIEMLEKMGAFDYIRKLKEDGKSKNIGFSYHGDADTLKKVLDTHGEHMDIIQLQLNYLDWETEGKAIYDVVRAHDKGIIVMSPIKGGALANLTPEVQQVFKKADPDASIASWALRFVMHLEGVITVLSGMSDMEQVEDNIKIADEMGPLTENEKKVIAQAMEEIKKVPQIQCTACKYCLEPCPKDINIPVIINSLNDYAKYQNLRAIRRMYTMITGGAWGGKPAKASDCISCGVCQTHCPQNIEIIEAMKEAVNLFE